MIVRLVSLEPLVLNRWKIQGSVFNNESICLVMQHTEFLTTIVQFFTDENDAHKFVTEIVYGSEV